MASSLRKKIYWRMNNAQEINIGYASDWLTAAFSL
jgi:hypothetical protein